MFRNISRWLLLCISDMACWFGSRAKSPVFILALRILKWTVITHQLCFVLHTEGHEKSRKRSCVSVVLYLLIHPGQPLRHKSSHGEKFWPKQINPLHLVLDLSGNKCGLSTATAISCPNTRIWCLFQSAYYPMQTRRRKRTSTQSQ